jgi:malate dehydrogenase
VRTIVEDENRMLTVSTQIRREVFGHEGVCVSVPTRVTRGGVFPIGVKLSDEETRLFAESVKLVRETTEKVCDILDSET